MGQLTRTDTPGSNPHTHGQLIFLQGNKNALSCPQISLDFSARCCGITSSNYLANTRGRRQSSVARAVGNRQSPLNQKPTCTPLTKRNSKWLEDLRDISTMNSQRKSALHFSMKLLLFFFLQVSLPRQNELQDIKMALIKLMIFCAAKETQKENDKTTHGRKQLQTLRSRLDLLNIETVSYSAQYQTTTSQSENGRRFTHSFSKKTYRWLKVYGQDAVHLSH